jgi:hypothetical protein
VALVLGLGLPPAAGQEPAEDERPPVLTAQTGTVGTGETFELGLDAASLPPDGTVELVLHGRIRSRSELAVSMRGDGLRGTVYQVTLPVSELPTAPDGSRRVAISLDPNLPGGLSLGASGVYPLEVRARDAAGTLLGTLVTHLVREPDDSDESPPLAVAVVARTLHEPALGTDGERVLDEAEVADLAPLLAVLADSGAPVSLTASADPLIALEAAAEGGDPAAAAVLEDLRAIAGQGAVLGGTYAPTTPDALVSSRLEGELDQHLDAFAATVREVLGVAPDTATWVAPSDLGEPGATALAERGVDRVVVDPDQVEPLRAGLLSLSLAQPYLVQLDDTDRELSALSLDRQILDNLGTDASPALEASHLVAELAMLWFEQPGIPRAAVLPIDADVRPEVAAALLAALDGGAILEAVTVEGAFAAAGPLLQPGGGRVDRELASSDPDRIAPAVRAQLAPARALLAGLASLLGGADEGATWVPTAAAHLLLATSTALPERTQLAHLDAVGAAVEQLTGAVNVPRRETVTLTARDGTVPLVVRNDGDVPLEVSVRLESSKLEFPEGDVLPLTLAPGSSRLDLAVRARASGSIPLTVTITSPDGSLTLAEVDYSIRSTAVAGAGIFLSAGAALFLMVWWARHWHRTRRSAKLIEAKHLSHPSGRPGARETAGRH